MVGKERRSISSSAPEAAVSYMVIHIFDCFRRPRKLEKEDRISGLPADVLIHIVSLLPLKEAASTGILSKRWQEIQPFCVRFDFDAQVVLGIPFSRTCYGSGEGFSEGRRKYIEWVNRVVRSHDGATTSCIDGFRIKFDLDGSSGEEVEEWVSYALARKVKRLELDLIGHGRSDCDFPRRLLLKQQSGGLRFLSLIALRVTHEDVKVLLQTFRLLEFLEVTGSPILTRVQVHGALALKHLVINSVARGHIRPLSGRGSMIIRDAPSLVTLESDYYFMHNLEIENAPNLVHARLPGFGWFINKVAVEDPARYCIYDLANMQALPDHPAFFSRLRLLTLDVESSYYHCEKVTHVPTQLTELKQLNLNVLAAHRQRFIYLTSLLMECPKLEKLVLKLERWSYIDLGGTESEPEPVQGLKLGLQIVEFHEYGGRSADDEFVRILLENSPALRTISIHPRQNAYLCAPMDAGQLKRCAQRLKRSVKLTFPSVEFVII